MAMALDDSGEGRALRVCIGMVGALREAMQTRSARSTQKADINQEP